MEELGGGITNQGSVFRQDDLVVRPAPLNAATLHRLLRHLARSGIPVPVPDGLDGSDELVRFIPGSTSVPPYPNPWVRSDSALWGIGHLLRHLHDASVKFDRTGCAWSSELADPEGGPVVCHNDVSIENVVFERGKLTGLLDFDFAAPGRRVWDLAMTARYWAPLQDPVSAAATGRDHLDPFARVRILFDSYGAGETERLEFVPTLLAAEEKGLEFVMARVERGDDAFIRMWQDLGGEERHKRRMAWIDEHSESLAECLG